MEDVEWPCGLCGTWECDCECFEADCCAECGEYWSHCECDFDVDECCGERQASAEQALERCRADMRAVKREGGL